MAVSDEELLSIIDHNYPRTYNLMVDAGPPDHFVKDADFTTVPNTIQYDITSASIIPAQDFWKVKQVYVVESPQGELRPLEPVNENNRLWFRAPQVACTVRLAYIPNCPKVTTYSQSLDFVSGWEEHLVALCCQDVKMKLEEDASPYFKKEQAVAEEIKRMSHRDAGYAERIVRRRHHDPYFLYRNNLDGYRLRGNYLELYYRSGYRAVP